VSVEQLLLAALVVANLVYIWLTRKECEDAKYDSAFYLQVLTDVANNVVEIKVDNQGDIEIREISGE
tara:strand:+ start:305 stop:505 length:201 start_codon:yes stop_codon:yes gene_type:complete